MKRKITTLLLSAVMLLALSVPAFADVMWEPYGNAFYESHREEMDYENRGYLANGQKGYVTMLAAPDSLVEVINLPNGTRFNVGMTWEGKNGEVWCVGYYSVNTENGWESYDGWIPMSDLALIYEYEEFAADHSGEFEKYDGSGDALTEVCLYSYPNGRYVGNLVESKDYMPFAESFEHLYTDENGLRWTFVGYYMGRHYAWACIDDPLNENLGTDGYLTVGQVRGSGDTLVPAEDAPEALSWPLWLIPVVLVIAVAVSTAALIRKKNKKAE